MATARRSGLTSTSFVRSALAGSCAVFALVACSATAVDGTPAAPSGTETSASRQSATSPPPAGRTVTVTPSIRPATNFAAVYSAEQSGVVRIETVSCTQSGVGTGFLVSPNLVLTVNHVIDQSAVISLIAGDQHTTGTVIGTDPVHDLALLRADQPIAGYNFRLRRVPAVVGDDVAAIGFPIGDPMTFTRGNISGLDRLVTLDTGATFVGLIETDAAINPGNSGGPLITADGVVAGLVEAKNMEASGIGYAVPAALAAADVRRWRDAPQPAPVVSCSDPLGPSQSHVSVPVPDQVDPSAAAGIVAAFTTYFDGINSGDYAAAFNVLSPRMRANTSERSFAEGDSTSYDSNVTVLDAYQDSRSHVTVGLSFTSLQTAAKGPNGDTCDMWTIEYSMIRGSGGSWFIDGGTPYNGSRHTTC